MNETNEPQAGILEALHSLAGEDGFIELPDYVRTVLYHPQHGYYRQTRPRVGRARQTDFYTSVSLREAFREIVVEAACALLQETGLDPAATDWVELGAEPEQSLLGDEAHPFRNCLALGIGDAPTLSGELMVFSNELFDAQAFRQLRFEDGQWREYGARLRGNALSWARRSALSDEAESYRSHLPRNAPEGYRIDLPTGANALARELFAQSWSGAFIAFDYGKTWTRLARDTPQGTARAYRSHQQKPDILDAPASQDITHHICWDHLEAALSKAGFARLSLQSQESFIVRRAPRFLQKAFDPSRDALDPLRTQLKELTHPALMGQSFQALTATRLA